MSTPTQQPLAFEVYVETYEITEWRDGCVYATASRGYAWHDKAAVDANRPAETGIVYAAASTDVALTHQTIRLARN